MKQTARSHQNTLVIEGAHVSWRQIVEAARADVHIEISTQAGFTRNMEQSRGILMDALGKGLPVYGVTTGFGKCCGKQMMADVARQNGVNLIRFHGCGTGRSFDIDEIRAAMICRLICFAKGYSGVSIELMKKIAAFLNERITPVVPVEGSVGASGDLTPMSYVAAALMGERRVFYRGRMISAAAALAEAGIEPYRFAPKEPLGIMNGTAMMTGVSVMVMDRAEKILKAAICATALSIHALMGNSHHYHPAISTAKPHPGQGYVAERIASLLMSESPEESFAIRTPETLQDPYSIRCSPQILGVLADTLEWVRVWVEIEANSANDNPLFDPQSGRILMGGNFYGGHITFAMDALKTALASVADMADRQVALMIDANSSRGLPADLVRVEEPEKPFHHGFKAMSISASALAAEALKGTMPAGSFSRSTESHNQDKVSMGTIAARDAGRICSLVEKTVAIHLITAAQACEIRGRINKRPQLERLLVNIRKIAPPTFEDRPMDEDIFNIASAIASSEMTVLDP